MRVISGKYKGKKLNGFDINGTRPTMDRVKESLMAMIQNKLKNSVVLDLFAGSGSLGIEAISNGAISCYFVDNNIKLINIIKENTEKIDESVNVMYTDYTKALLEFKNKNIKFDIIFLDPPYKLNLINDCISKIKEYSLLNNEGIIVLEYENEVINTLDYKILKQKKYGSKNIMIVS